MMGELFRAPFERLFSLHKFVLEENNAMADSMRNLSEMLENSTSYYVLTRSHKFPKIRLLSFL